MAGISYYCYHRGCHRSSLLCYASLCYRIYQQPQNANVAVVPIAWSLLNQSCFQHRSHPNRYRVFMFYVLIISIWKCYPCLFCSHCHGCQWNWIVADGDTWGQWEAHFWTAVHLLQLRTLLSVGPNSQLPQRIQGFHNITTLFGVYFIHICEPY